ncbi:hypothetical protein AVEN_74703-1 [Araneus ventricosus]|uniref:Uncharacterized protein n=1 Tax=Araneus ventricosus TaxID=182803 RepID=A0A4Y2GEC9_ARAVE|nr:hypothetical protein AVEN_74703-1 [Araneus ventricosus]
MVTLLCECESVVNGRPLTYLYDDPNELRAIKLSDFIQDIKGNATVDLDIVDANHLQMSSTDISKSVLENIESVSDVTDDVNRLHTASNEHSSQADTHRKGQSQTVKKTFCGQRIVPVKRMDL